MKERRRGGKKRGIVNRVIISLQLSYNVGLSFMHAKNGSLAVLQRGFHETPYIARSVTAQTHTYACTNQLAAPNTSPPTCVWSVIGTHNYTSRHTAHSSDVFQILLGIIGLSQAGGVTSLRHEVGCAPCLTSCSVQLTAKPKTKQLVVSDLQ